MIFKKINIESCELNLKNKLINSKSTYTIRHCFIIILEIDDYVGYGEASPLPLFSNETSKEIAWKFEEIKASLLIGEGYDKEELLELFYLIAKDTPSLNFALDIALYDILSKKNKIFLSKYLNKNACETISFSSLYSSKNYPLFKTVKVKLGIKKNIHDDIVYFKNIAKELNDNTVFRLDLNQAYTIEEVINLYNQLSSYQIEYIEEPIDRPTVDAISKIKKHTQFALALDESIINGNYDRMITSSNIDYAILKAPLFGSIKNIMLFKSYLEKYNVSLILSSCLQSPIGNMSQIHIASALELDGDHGLNNHVFFDYLGGVPYEIDSLSVNLNHLVGLGVKYDY